MIFFFDIPHLAAEAKKTAKATGQKLSEVQHAIAKAKGYTSWSSMVGAAVGPDKPEALVAWFARKHEPMRDDVESWIYEELLSEARPEQILAEAGYDTSPGFDAAVDQIWNRSVWYSRAQVEMADWFVRNHSSAVDHSPYDGREGGYLWPTVEVLDVLQHQFPEMSEKDIDEVAEVLDSQGAWIESKRLRERERDATNEMLDRQDEVREGSAMASELDEIFVIFSDGLVPIASISRRNFIKYEMVGRGQMKIHFKALRVPFDDIWEERNVIFDVEPSNKHVLGILRRWGV